MELQLYSSKPSIKISQLPEVLATTGSERMLLVQGGVSKQVFINKFFDGLKSDRNFSFNVQTNTFSVVNDSIALITAIGNSINKVGISQTNPQTTLHVGGSVTIGTSATIANYTTSAPAVGVGVFITPYEFIRDVGTITIGVDTTLFSVSSARTYSLADGTKGQTKTFILLDKVGSGSVIITPTHLLKHTSITLTELGASATLKFVHDKWVVVSAVNVSLA